MEFNVKVTVDLGERTIALLTGVGLAPKSEQAAIAEEAVEVKKEQAAAVVEEEKKPAEPKKSRSRSTKSAEAVQAVEVITQPAASDTAARAEVDDDKTDAERIAEERAKAKAAKSSTSEVDPAFAELDDDAKLEAIKAAVTQQTRNRKGADVKFMLAQFDAARASELSTECYDGFYTAITRFANGESLDIIFQKK